MKDDENKISAEVMTMALKIMEVAMQHQRTRTTKETTGDKPTVFVEFVPSNAVLRISYYDYGFDYDAVVGKNFHSKSFALTSSDYLPYKKMYDGLVAEYAHIRKLYESWEANQNA